MYGYTAAQDEFPHLSICACALICFPLQVMFQYQGVKKVRVGRQHWDLNDEEDWGPGSGRHRNLEERWDGGVYERVFLQPSAALAWESWNRSLLPYCHCFFLW